MNLNEIYTLKEAADIWGISDSNLRNAFRTGRFDKQIEKGLAKRSGSTYIITKQAMLNVFGEPKEEVNMFDQLNEYNSTVIEWEGKVLKTTQDPFVDERHYGDWRDEEHRYTAPAIDKDGNEYFITWEVKDEEAFLEQQDESDVCDWDNPTEVEKL